MHEKLKQSKNKVLVIDDEKVIRENIRAFLEDMDYDVNEAQNGKIGIDLFEKYNPDIVIVDLRMPELGGFEVIKYISKKNRQIPIIVISGTGLLKDAIDAIRLGAWDYITKPIVDMNAVLHVIKNSIEKSRLIIENEQYKNNLENQVRQRTLELELEIKSKKNTERLLRESEEMLSSIVGNIPGATYRATIKQEKFYIEFISDVVFYITGYTKGEFLNDNSLFEKVFTREEKKGIISYNILDAIKNKHSFFNEYEIIRKDNVSVWVLERGQGVYDSNGKLLFIAGSIFDVTNEKKAERDLKIAFEKMEKADRLKTEFLANMSHEIRTPMTSIIGFSDLLGNTKLTEEQKNFLEVIKKSSSHLLVIINDIIDIAKIESDQIEIKRTPVDLYDILNDIRLIFNIKQKELKKQIEFLIKDVEKGEIIFSTDFVRLKQLLINLISNSFKFTDKGFINVSYEIKTSTIKFSVKDSGIGIPEEKGEEIFEKFTQADASFTRKHGGIGLGLAISKKICGFLGGNLKFESVLGKGSNFYFEIPFREIKTKTAKKIVNKTNLNIEGNNETILIVEDTKENILFLKAFLSRANYNVIFAHNGLEAFDMYRARKDITLVLMDIQMPVMDGMEAIKNIREYENINSDINKPVIALTGHAMAGDEIRFIQAGFSDYISKPFRINEILSKITKYT
ncbi:MAG: response regulator [Candidatus Muirbacterium halophilum]|nr:response regulator [Candidatus Muirbacterium halophilum]MCK9475476.1 response regulator [Candidatus Muirbacterium halophilum]